MDFGLGAIVAQRLAEEAAQERAQPDAPRARARRKSDDWADEAVDAELEFKQLCAPDKPPEDAP